MLMKKNFRQLKERVTIQEVNRTPDGMGGYTETWVDLQTVWAQVIPIFYATQTKEAFTAEQMVPVMTYRVRIRYNPIMTLDKRLKWGNRILEPRSVINEDGRGEFMLMFCDEVLLEDGSG